MDIAQVQQWVAGYVKAWNSNESDDITALFTEEALYYTEPFRDPWVGHDEIVSGWLEAKDEPGETAFTYDVLVMDGDLAIVKGVTRYREPPRAYSNLWEIRLTDDGRCREFVEWYMKHDGT